MLASPNKSARLLSALSVSAAVLGAALTASAANPVDLAPRSIDGFPFNPGTATLTNVGSVTATAGVWEGKMALAASISRVRRYSYSLYNDCVFNRSPTVQENGVTNDRIRTTTCTGFLGSNPNVVTHVHAQLF